MPTTTTRRYYSNNAPQQQLSLGITSGDLSLTVTSFAGWPVTFPFYAVINASKSDAEIIRIDEISGATATIGERGSDGSSAQSHSAGATLDQCFIAKDLDEANAHSSATAGVHGVSGDLVGDTDAQTLTHKTIDTAESNVLKVNGNTLAATAGTHTVTMPDATDTLVGRDTVDTLTNKTLTDPDINGATLDSTSTIGGVSGTSISNRPRGRAASLSKSAVVAYTDSGAFLTGLADAAFTVSTGRRYKVTVTLVDFISQTLATGADTFTIYDGLVAAPTTSSPIVHQVHATPVPSSALGTVLSYSFEITAVDNSEHRFGIHALSGTSGGSQIGSTSGSSHLIIEDIGV